MDNGFLCAPREPRCGQIVSSPGYYRKYQVLMLETNLYDTTTKQLIWSMQSESIDASAPQKVIDEQIALTIERLVAHGLVTSTE